MYVVRNLAAVVAMVMLSVSASWAQAAAEVVGTVTDSSGGVVAGAQVEVVVVNQTAGRATSDGSGRYAVSVPSGVRLLLIVRAAGFADEVVDLAPVSSSTTRDVTLAIGSVSDTVVITAARGAEARTTATQSVTVMTAADIQALGSNSLAEVVRFAPGLAVEGNGREGALTSLFARGGESDYNLVLIDGVRANLDGGQFDFSRVAGSEIERVEIVRGAQSSLWGSDAMGSVIQIFTRRAGALDAPRVSGNVEGGSFDTFRGDARLTGGVRGRADYQIGVTRRQTNGAFADILTQPDKYEQTAFDAGFGATLGKRASVRTNLRNSHSDGRLVGPLTYGARDTGGLYLTRDFTWTVQSNHTASSWYTGSASFNYYRYRNENNDTILDAPYSTYAILTGTQNALFPNGMRLVRLIDAAEYNSLVAAGGLPAPGQVLASRVTTDFASNSARQFRRPAFRYQGDVAWGGGQRFSVGYEWEREHNPLVAVQDLHNNAAFVQQQFSFADRWFVTAGIRVDAKDTYDTFASPKLSAGGFLVPFRNGGVSSVRVFGNIGRGIKSPTFTERYGGSFADPDPNLKVEQARTSDLGIESTFASQRFRAGLTFFDNDYTNQVAFRSGIAGDGIPEYINIDGSAAHGWELEGALQRPIGGVTIIANYSFVDTKVVTNVSTSQQFQPGQPLLRRPKNSGSVRIAYNVRRFTADFNTRWIGDRHDNSFLSLRTVPNTERPTAVTTDITVNPGYMLMELGASVKLHDALSLFARVENLADRKWDSALGYPGAPRAGIVGARFNVSGR